MSAPIAVNTSSMINAAGDMMDKHDAILQQVQSLQGHLQSLSQSWKGDTANAFGGAMQNFYDDSNTILKALNTLATNVDSAAKTYESAHQMTTADADALAQRISSHPVGLPGF